jgi:hypothetical protein
MRKPPSVIFYHREYCLIFGYSPKCLDVQFSEVQMHDPA